MSDRLDRTVVRFKAREIEKTYATPENRLRRTPTDIEVAPELSISINELHSIFNEISSDSVVALDELLTVGAERGERLSLAETLEDKGRRGPAGRIRGRGAQDHPRRGHQPPPRAGDIVITLYYEGLTLAEIGQVLGVTESRVCQLHTKAALQLRRTVQDARG